ncbi:flavin-containing monooxygenase [Nakamurella deserti]|uniref:FAD-dependent oxidoreductase n=1 Tax=Nakamurella deserti TaxID=2164074 RepID=UPI000DBE7137
MEQTDVLVIGAGQAGLSAAYHLRRTGIPHVVLDANAAPGGAWQHRWPTLTMATVNGIRELPDFPVPPGNPEERASDAVPRYFAEYERAFDLDVRRPVRVRSVSSRGDLLLASTDTGDIAARALINATGTWTRPFWPTVPGMRDFAGRQLHTADYPGPAAFAGQRMLVVGGGVSALQALMELGPVTAAQHWITRRPPAFVDREFTAEFGRAAVRLVEDRVAVGLPPRSVVSVTGLPSTPAIRHAQAAGFLDRRPMFDRLTVDGAAWADGSTIAVDTVLWATGFRAALDHLRPLHLRGPGGGIVMDRTAVAADPRIHLVGYGPRASTVGANRAGRAAVAVIRRYLDAADAADALGSTGMSA